MAILRVLIAVFLHPCGVSNQKHHFKTWLSVISFLIRTTRTGSSEPDDCHFFAVGGANIGEVFCERLIHLMKAQHVRGANDSTPSVEKERHLWSHQSGLWMCCHLRHPSTPARQRERHKNRLQGEVRSLFTLISHAVGWNNNGSGFLYIPIHRRLKQSAPKDCAKRAFPFARVWSSVYAYKCMTSNRGTSHLLMELWLSRIKHLDRPNLSKKLDWCLILRPRTSL